MLRHYRQHAGGVKVYTERVLEQLLVLGNPHQFVFMYADHDLIGTYAGYPNVVEVALPLGRGVLWDQLAAPILAHWYGVDVLFNPKFAVPFLTRKPKVFVQHGSEWFVIPEAFAWYDRIYTRNVVPWYCRAATRILTVSNRVKADAVEFTGVAPEKFVTVYNGFDHARFYPVTDPERRAEVRSRYQLPKRYLFWAGQIYPPKNVERILAAFTRVCSELDLTLVMAGETYGRAMRELSAAARPEISDRVLFTGWVPHEDMATMYSMAELFVFPSLYEGFGIPLIEAMACGCPVLTANTGSPPEVVRNAAVLVDPLSVDQIADGIRQVLTSAELRSALVERGLERARDFGWDRCAREVLTALEGCITPLPISAIPTP